MAGEVLGREQYSRWGLVAVSNVGRYQCSRTGFEY